MELGHGEVGWHLLDLALDARLRLELHHHARVGAAQDVGVQLGLARAVAAHGVEVHAGLDHLRQQDGGVALVGRGRGHDVAAAHRLGCAGAAFHRQAWQRQARQVAFQLEAGAGVGVEQAQRADAQQVVEGQRLELALRAVADQRHAAAVGPGQVPSGQHRHGGRAQRGGERQLGHQQRVARVHIGQHAEGGDGEQALGRVLGVAVDVLEAVQPPVAGGHEFDHAHGRMDGVPRRLVELLPAAVIAVHGVHQPLQKVGQPHLPHQFAHAVHAEVIHHDHLLDLCSGKNSPQGHGQRKVRNLRN